MSWNRQERELQIELIKLQLKMQRRTTEYSIFLAFILSSAIVITFTLYGWGFSTQNNLYVIVGMIVAIGLFSFAGFIALYYKMTLDELERQIRYLKGKYLW